MTRKKNITPQFDIEPDGQVAINIKPREFGEFLKSCLGQNRSIQQIFHKVFVIDHKWFMQLHNSIKQRIAGQLSAELMEFSARISLSNGREVLVTSVKDFEAYYDVSPYETVAVKLTWTYLVNFPNKTHPEKQEIRIKVYEDEFSAMKAESFIDALLFPQDLGPSRIATYVEYTEITFGEDIISLITRQINKSFPSNKTDYSKVRRIFGTGAIPILLFVFTFLLLFIYGWELQIDITNKYNTLLASLQNNDQLNIHKKIDFIAIKRSLITGFTNMFFIKAFSVVSITISFIAFILMRNRSFLIFNEIDKRQHKDFKKRNNFIYGGVFLALLVGIVAGLIANYLPSLAG